MGQNSSAADLSGVRVKTTRLAAYVISGALAGLGGVLLSARVGGAFLEMGNPFLLQSVGAVVVGGSSILGGKATALGTFPRIHLFSHGRDDHAGPSAGRGIAAGCPRDPDHPGPGSRHRETNLSQ